MVRLARLCMLLPVHIVVDPLAVPLGRSDVLPRSGLLALCLN